MKTIDFAEISRRARSMSDYELVWNARDASEAAEAAEELEKAGCRVLKTGGYYRDEATVYRSEMRRRNLCK